MTTARTGNSGPAKGRRRQRSTDARCAYLVLGMHRSGTSATTQLLALAGTQLPRNVMPGDEHNAKGYFEPWRIATFNDERLRAATSAWDDVFAFPFAPRPDAEEQGWRERARDIFLEEFDGAPFPLMKDPRATVLLPLWREVLQGLGLPIRCVVPVRHPLAVAGSLGRRDGFSPEKSVLLWTAYMLAAEAYSRDLPRAFVSYDALLSDWRAEAARIEAAHGAALPALDDVAARQIDTFLTPELRHNREQADLASLGWTGELAEAAHRWFAAAARDEAPDPAVLDAVAAELADRQRQVGPLISPAARDLDVARHELLSLRQAMEFERGELEALKARFDKLQRDWWDLRGVIDETGWALESILAE
jgi:hypothetical protein